jgi:hypothetical protein
VRTKQSAFLITGLVLAAGAAMGFSSIWNVGLASIWDSEGETVLAEAPEAVKSFYCTVFSPDMRSVAYAARVYKGVHKKEAVYLNEKSGPMFDFIRCDQKLKDGGLNVFKTGVNSLTFSGDGKRFAYQARNAKEKWRFILDDKEYWKIKGNYHFAASGNSIAAQNCKSLHGCCWRTDDGIGTEKKEGEICPSLVEFPEDLGGKAVPVTYEAGAEGTRRVVVGESQGPWFEKFRNFTMSPDGAHFSYVGCKEGQCTAVFDNVEQSAPYPRILDAVMDKLGKAALIAKKDKGFVVSYGGEEGSTYKYVTTPLVPDGKGRVFFLATLGEEKFAIMRQGGGKKASTSTYPCIHNMRTWRGPKLSATFPYYPEMPVLLSPDASKFAFYACCNSCCKPTDKGCKKAGCMADGADFQARVVINKNGKGSIGKGQASKCHPPGSIHGFTWSPDSSKYAYVLSTGKSSTLFVNNKAVASRAGETFSTPLFTPDGSQVVYVGWRKKAGGKVGKVYAGATAVSKEYDTIEWPARISEDGKYAAFNAVKGRVFLLVVVELSK